MGSPKYALAACSQMLLVPSSSLVRTPSMSKPKMYGLMVVHLLKLVRLVLD